MLLAASVSHTQFQNAGGHLVIALLPVVLGHQRPYDYHPCSLFLKKGAIQDSLYFISLCFLTLNMQNKKGKKSESSTEVNKLKNKHSTYNGVAAQKTVWRFLRKLNALAMTPRNCILGC